MTAVEIIEEAEVELLMAAEFYGRQAPGLRAAVIDEFERMLRLMVEHPAIGTPYEGGTRRALFDRFPYAIVYREKSTASLELIAVMHLHPVRRRTDMKPLSRPTLRGALGRRMKV